MWISCVKYDDLKFNSFRIDSVDNDNQIKYLEPWSSETILEFELDYYNS